MQHSVAESHVVSFLYIYALSCILLIPSASTDWCYGKTVISFEKSFRAAGHEIALAVTENSSENRNFAKCAVW